MIWFRRLLLLPTLGGLSLLLGYFLGHENLTSMDLAGAGLLALAAGITLFVLLRLFAAVALALSLVLGILLLLATLSAAAYFLLEREQALWFNNQDELPMQLPPEDVEREYLNSIGLSDNPLPPLNWWEHAKHQAETGLASQQPRANQLGKPHTIKNADEVWLNWLSQLMMLCFGLLGGTWFGSINRKRPRYHNI